MTRLAEIRQRLADLENVPANRSYAGVHEEFMNAAQADVKYLLELTKEITQHDEQQ